MGQEALETHLVTATRSLVSGTVTMGQIDAILIAVFAPITMYLYRNKK